MGTSGPHARSASSGGGSWEGLDPAAPLTTVHAAPWGYLTITVPATHTWGEKLTQVLGMLRGATNGMNGLKLMEAAHSEACGRGVSRHRCMPQPPPRQNH